MDEDEDTRRWLLWAGVALLAVAVVLGFCGCETDEDECRKGEPGCVCWYDDPDIENEDPPDVDGCAEETECLRDDDEPCEPWDPAWPLECTCIEP